MVAIAPFDFQAHDTFFVVAHLHTVLIGGAVFPLLAGLYYYYPLRQRQAAVGAARPHRRSGWCSSASTSRSCRCTCTGLLGMPRRVFTYPAGLGFETLNLVSTDRRVRPRRRASPWSSGTSCGRRRRSRIAPRNPWNAGTLEWLQEMPGQPWGMRTIPEIDTPLSALGAAELRARLRRGPLLPARRRGRPARDARHLDASTPSRSSACASPGRPSSRWSPPSASAASSSSPTFKLYGWMARQRGARRSPPSSSGCGPAPARSRRRRRRTSASGCACRSTSRAATRSAGGRCSSRCSAIFTAFVSLVFGYFFFWTLHEDFPPEPARGPGVLVAGSAAALLARRVGADRRSRAAGTPRSRRARSTRRCWPRPSLGRRSAAPRCRRPVDDRARSDGQRLRRHRLAAGDLDRAARRRRRRHAALLRRPPRSPAA